MPEMTTKQFSTMSALLADVKAFDEAIRERFSGWGYSKVILDPTQTTDEKAVFFVYGYEHCEHFADTLHERYAATLILT